jgi:hypothetical protein
MIVSNFSDHGTGLPGHSRWPDNANHQAEGRDHYYAPFPGHPAVENFIEFKNHPFVWFEDELPCLYRKSL